MWCNIYIDLWNQDLKFRPNDRVSIRNSQNNTLEGPYVIASIVDGARYTLCDDEQNEVHGNRAFEESDLEEYNLF